MAEVLEGKVTRAEPSRSGAIAKRGIRTGEDFANFMSALMSDVIDGSVSPVVSNAAVNAAGKLLKVVEMQYRYRMDPATRGGSLVLAPGDKRRDSEIEA